MTTADVEYDMTPRYAPTSIISHTGGGRFATLPVRRWVVHPPGTHPDSPIKSDMLALECVTDGRSAWYGVLDAYINAELRMVVVGTNRLDEVRMKWPAVPESCRVNRP